MCKFTVEQQADHILASRRRTNRPHEDGGQRIIGWIVPDDQIGLGEALLALEEIERRAGAKKLLSEADILPCPFCGNSPKVEMTGFHGGGRTIRCEAIDCMGPHTTAACVDDAVFQWNRRASPRHR